MTHQPDDPGVSATIEPRAKPWYESKGIQGSLAAIGSSLGLLVGVITGHVAFDPVTFGAAVTSLAGGCLSLYGRWTASAQIRGRHDRASQSG